MYSRNYFSDDQQLKLPENYDGTAFMERGSDDKMNGERSEDTPQVEEVSQEGSILSGSFQSKPTFLSSLFSNGGILGNIGLKIPNIGAEEILIIATAAFLLFSKNGDRECALILLLLLFIN